MRRISILAVGTLLALAALAGTAFAKEGAVTKLDPLPPGVYELVIHLGYDDEELRGATWDHPDWGAAWRQADFNLVRSPEFQRFLHDRGFILIRWKDLTRALPPEVAPR